MNLIRVIDGPTIPDHRIPQFVRWIPRWEALSGPPGPEGMAGWTMVALGSAR